MKFIFAKLSNIGGLMAVAGIVSLLLSFFNYNVRLLRWIDQWGDGTGLAIRIGLIVGGGIIFFVFAALSGDNNTQYNPYAAEKEEKKKVV